MKSSYTQVDVYNIANEIRLRENLAAYFIKNPNSKTTTYNRALKCLYNLELHGLIEKIRPVIPRFGNISHWIKINLDGAKTICNSKGVKLKYSLTKEDVCCSFDQKSIQYAILSVISTLSKLNGVAQRKIYVKVTDKENNVFIKIHAELPKEETTFKCTKTFLLLEKTAKIHKGAILYSEEVTGGGKTCNIAFSVSKSLPLLGHSLYRYGFFTPPTTKELLEDSLSPIHLAFS